MRRYLTILLAGAALLAMPSPADAVSGQTVRFVAGFEGFRSCVYADPAGHATIGFGHLLHYGPPTRADRRKWGCLTRAQAMALLRKDLRSYQAALLARIRGARVTPAMITALTSFAFNLGPGALDFMKANGKGRNTNIAWHVRAGNYRTAASQMRLFDGIIVNGKRYVLEGLRIRRRKEFNLMVRDIPRLTNCGNNCPGRVISGGVAVRSKSGGLALRPRR
jgi:GH24 family phage-related lysozyme (muramidase)